MKLVLLTTDTLHHVYFVRELAPRFPLARIFVETTGVTAPFPTAHPYEAERDDYERTHWFGAAPPPLETFAPVTRCARMRGAAAELRALAPEVIVVFGTGRLGAEVIGTCPTGIINLHGGDAERYRGLDSDLWSIYHGDFAALAVTLHRLNAELDDGELILEAPIPLHRGMGLHELRAVKTEVCVRLVVAALAMYQALGAFISRPQRQQGRYYSFMPAPLKDLCVERFAQHTREL